MCQHARMKKGSQTQLKIIDQAIYQASKQGLAGLTIGSLASTLKMSKSGLFAHFGSKVQLQKQVITAIFEQYQQDIIEPALQVPAGCQQIKALMQLWVEWSKQQARPGGCPLASSLFDTTELDAEVKALLQVGMQGLTAVFEAAIEAAKQVDLDATIETRQLTMKLIGIYYAQHIDYWLLNDANATQQAMQAVESLLLRPV